MKRFQEEINRMKREQKLFFRTVGIGSVRERGRYRKKHALDCGKVRCGICHYDKYPKREKHEHEIKSDMDYREQMEERYD